MWSRNSCSSGFPAAFRSGPEAAEAAGAEAILAKDNERTGWIASSVRCMRRRMHGGDLFNLSNRLLLKTPKAFPDASPKFPKSFFAKSW